MLRIRSLFAGLVCALAVSAAAAAAPAPRVQFKTSMGNFTVEVYPDKAPKTVANFLQYVKDGHYNGIIFHRVIDGFMAQTGDPKGNGTGGSSLPNIPAEFTQAAQFRRGTVGMARSQDPNSANSQFFIVFDDATFLDRQYTVWGQVESGMEHVDALPKGEPPREPGKIVKATVVTR